MELVEEKKIKTLQRLEGINLKSPYQTKQSGKALSNDEAMEDRGGRRSAYDTT